MKELTISMRTHHFLVSGITPRSRPCVLSFARRQVQYGFARGRGAMKPALKTFAASTADRSEFRFHINHWKEFQEEMMHHRLSENLVEIVHEPIHEGLDVVLPVKPQWVPKDDQPLAIEYLAKPPPPRSKCVIKPPGTGKTFCALMGMSKIGKRAVGIMKPQFLENWLEGAMKTYDIVLEDMVVVSGSKQLITLLNLAIEDRLPQKIILISNKTMQNYITTYEQYKEGIIDMGYPCYPDQMLEVLQAGVRFIDEVHMDFHLNFKLDLYTNIEQTSVYTATFISDDQKVKQMMFLAYPPKDRYVGPAIKPYVRTRAIFYAFREPDKIKCRETGSTSYSHNVFEESILKHPRIMGGYFDLIETTVKQEFLDPDFYKPGDKGILFCSSVAMCTALQDYLQKKFPQLDIRRKVADDDREELRAGDLVISTLGSGGTGHDIPNLTWVGLTTNVKSSSGNIQGHGRLRELKAIPGVRDTAREPRFTYLVNEDNLKHIEYHEAKKDLIVPLSTTYRIVHYQNVI